MKPDVLIHPTDIESNFKKCFPELTVQQHGWKGNPFADTSRNVVPSPLARVPNMLFIPIVAI
jgi:hypothetical protein